MNAPEHFQQKEQYAYFRPEGEVTMEEATALLERSLEYCADQQIGKLLVNATSLTGLGSPSLADRFFLATRAAEASKRRVHVAIVVQTELIHPQKFGVQVARSRGLVIEVFDSEPQAEAWLLVSDFNKRP